jgi:hypothetical protein
MEIGANMGTLEGRINVWTSQDGLVGSTFNSIRDAVMRGYRDRFHFVDFDELTQTPKRVIQGVYNFLDKSYYEHDFKNISQYTKENDAEHGFTDLHTIRPEIKPLKDDSKEILGHLHEQFKNFHFNF